MINFMENFTIIIIIYLMIVFLLYLIGEVKQNSTLKGLAIVFVVLMLLESGAYFYITPNKLQEDSIDTDLLYGSM